MTRIVLDCSVAMSWCFRDEQTPFALNVLDQVKKNGAVVPAIWPFEVFNTLWIAEKRKRLDTASSTHFLDLLSKLPILIDQSPLWPPGEDLLDLSRKHNLTAYDAAYLELAIRRRIPLGTLDKGLSSAAKKAGVKLVRMTRAKIRSENKKRRD